MSNEVKFSHGKDMNLNNVTISDGTFYVTEENGKLFLGHNGKLLPLLQSDLNEDQTFMEWFEWPLVNATATLVIGNTILESHSLTPTLKRGQIYIDEYAVNQPTWYFEDDPDNYFVQYEFGDVSICPVDGAPELSDGMTFSVGSKYYYVPYQNSDVLGCGFCLIHVHDDGSKDYYMVGGYPQGVNFTWGDNLTSVNFGSYSINCDSSEYPFWGISMDNNDVSLSEEDDITAEAGVTNDICTAINSDHLCYGYLYSTKWMNQQVNATTVNFYGLTYHAVDDYYTRDGVLVNTIVCDDPYIYFDDTNVYIGSSSNSVNNIELFRNAGDWTISQVSTDSAGDNIITNSIPYQYNLTAGETYTFYINPGVERNTQVTFYQLPYNGTQYNCLGTFTSSASNPSVSISYDNSDGTNSIVDFDYHTILGGSAIDNIKMYNSEGIELISPSGGNYNLTFGETYTFYLVYSSDEFINPNVVTTVNIYNAIGSYMGTLITSDPNPEIKLFVADLGEIYLKGSIPDDKDGNNDKWEYFTEEDGYGAAGYGAGIYVAVNGAAPYGFSVDNDNNITSDGDIEWGTNDTKYISLEAGKTYTYYVYGEDDIIEQPPDVVTTINIAGHILTSPNPNSPTLQFSKSTGTFNLDSESTYTIPGYYSGYETVLVPLLGAPDFDSDGFTAVEPGGTYYYTYWYDDGGIPTTSFMIIQKDNISFAKSVAGDFVIDWTAPSVANLGDKTYSTTSSFAGLSVSDDNNVTSSGDISYGNNDRIPVYQGVPSNFIYYLYDEDDIITMDKVQIYKYQFTDFGRESYLLTETDHSGDPVMWYDYALGNGYSVEYSDNGTPQYIYYELADQKFYITDNGVKVDALSQVEPDHRYDSGPVLTPIVSLGSDSHPASKDDTMKVTIEIPDSFTIEGSTAGMEVLEWINTTTGESGMVTDYATGISSIGGFKTSHTPTSSGIYEYRYSASITLYDPSDSMRSCTISNHSTIEAPRVEFLVVDQNTENIDSVLDSKGIVASGNFLERHEGKFNFTSNPWMITMSEAAPFSDAPNYMHKDYYISHCIYNIDNPTAPTEELYYTGQNYGSGGWVAADTSSQPAFKWYRCLIDGLIVTDYSIGYSTKYQTSDTTNPPNDSSEYSEDIDSTTFTDSTYKSFSIARVVPAGEGQITFTVCGDTYKAREGETWGDWINRTMPYNISNQIYIYCDGNPLYYNGNQVMYDHVIEPSGVYTVQNN